MSADIGKQLHRLARRQQVRIWMKRLSGRVPALLWWNACVLFTGGCVHQLILPLNSTSVLSVAIAPSLLAALLLAVAEIPSADEGAAAADRLFGANSLFVTVWELNRSAAVIEGAGPLLLARAESALPLWRRHEHRPQQRDMKPASLGAVTLALAGLLFLLLPSHVRTSETSHTAPAGQTEPGSRTDNSAMVLSELFTTTKQQTTRSAGQVSEQKRTPAPAKATASKTSLPAESQVEEQSLRRIAQTDAEAAAHTLPPQAAVNATRQPGTTDPLQNESKKIPDRTPGNDAASETASVTSRAQAFSQTRLIDIETGTETRSRASDVDREGAALLVSGPQVQDFRAPVAGSTRPGSQTASSLLSAEQRALVRRYFKQLEQTDEPNE